ncbi:MAG: glycosyltransferase [Anaeromyxobacter sp.]
MHVSTIGETLGFLDGHAAVVRARCGLEVHALSAPGAALERFGQREGVPVHPVPMARAITPLRDLRALLLAWRTLRRLRPAVVDAHTPKGGLIGMLAAWLARVPVRVYHVHGLPLSTATGRRRRLLRAAERVACRLATCVLPVSRSVAERLVDERLCAPGKVRVVAEGSINGVDGERFAPASAAARAASRAALGLPEGAKAVGFLGRLAQDKGLAELAAAWAILRERRPEAWLFLAGEPDDSDPVAPGVLERLVMDPRVRLLGDVSDTPAFYAGLDLVAVPTYREGFPTVPLEAAAAGLPVVASRVDGCVDAVVDGVTGTLVPSRDPGALAGALERYLADPPLAAAHGRAARRRVLERYRPAQVREALAEAYGTLLRGDGTAAARAQRPARREAGDSSPAR